MNALTTTPPQRPGQGRGQPDGRQVASSLNQIRAALLSPFDRMDRFRAEHPQWHRGLFDVRAIPCGSISTRGVRERALEDQRARLAVLPPGDLAKDMHGGMSAAASKGHNVNQTRLIVGAMIDAFPNARPHNPVVYIESLIHELQASGYSPAVVAKACNEMTRTAIFPPSVAEVLARCDEVRKNLDASVRLLEMLVAARPMIETNIEMLEGLTDLPTEDEQRAAIAETLRSMGGLGAAAGRGLGEARQ